VYTSCVRRGALCFLFNEIYLLIKKKMKYLNANARLDFDYYEFDYFFFQGR
jgi:hypothetical protein